MTYKTSNVHLVIVTGQAQANLIPILQLKPEVVVLAVSNDMKKQADEFVKVLNNANVNYKPKDILRFDDVPASNLPEIEKMACKIYSELCQKYPAEKITYHATGGTKLMMLGFCNVFAKQDNEVIYTGTAEGFIEVVYPAAQPSIAIEHVLTMETYLSSLGEQYKPDANQNWGNIAKQHKNLTFWLANNAEYLDHFFTVMNGFVMKAKDDFKQGRQQSEQVFRDNPRGIWIKALKKLTTDNICLWDEKNPKKVIFNDENRTVYIAGLWLEEYVWLIAHDLKISEVVANVEFTEQVDTNDRVQNEVDCVAVHSNRLLLIECKTIKFSAEEKGKHSDILYKLHTLSSRAGGLYGDKWLVSAKSLDQYTQARAEAYKIKTIAGKQLKSLKAELERWRDAKR